MLFNNPVRSGSSLLDMMLTANQGYTDLFLRASKSMLDISKKMMDVNTIWTETQSRALTTVPDVTRQFNGQASEQVVAIGEEVLDVGVRKVIGESTRVRRVVRIVPVEKQVELHDETITIERRPVARPGDVEALTEREYVMIDTREIPVVSKDMRVREELVLRKEVNGHTETIRDTVRVSDVEVQQPQRMPTVTDQPRKDERHKNHH